MKYDKIRGKSVSECMMKLRSMYGTSAIIIATREVKEGGVLGSGIFSRKMYEIDFMVEEKGGRLPRKSGAPLSTGLSEARPRERSETSSSRVTNTLAGSRSESDNRLKQSAPAIRQAGSGRSSGNTLPDMDEESGEDVAALLRHLNERVAAPVPRSGEKNVPVSIQRGPVEEDTQSDRSPGFGRGTGARLAPPVDYSRDELEALMRMERETLEEGEDEEGIPMPPPELSAAPSARKRSGIHAEFVPSPPERGDAATPRSVIEERDPAARVFHRIRNRLLGAQLSREFTEAFLNNLDHHLSRMEKGEYRKVEEKTLQELASMIRTVPDIAPPRGEVRAVMLVGPTGSGKTTSLAKLAARYHIMENREVSIYSLDHYRLAATEQLKIYANVMQAPFHSPLTPEEFQENLERDGAELILIDTSGIGYRDRVRMANLKKFIEVCPIRLEKHLVIAANTNPSLVEKILLAYDEIGFDKIMLTKLDETEFIGSFIENADRFNRPFSFLMNGQEVPGDILAAGPMEMARMVLQEELSAVKN